MKINLTQNLIGFDEKQILGPDEKPLILKDLFLQALLVQIEGDDKMEATKKVELWKLAQTIHRADDEIDLPLESLQLLKVRVGKIFVPAVVGPIYEIIG